MNKNYNPEKHHRKSIRLKGYDYTSEGIYFVTVCTYNKECILGNISNGKMLLNKFGEIVYLCWKNIPTHFPNTRLNVFFVMPNHIHGIIHITRRGTACCAPTKAPAKEYHNSKANVFNRPVKNSLPVIIRSFKSAATKQINLLRNTPGITIWQRNYYERIVRDEKDLNQIKEYIINNPLKWELDEENPQKIIQKNEINKGEIRK